MANKKYYDIKNLLSTGAAYLMLLGQRSNGKSYQVKYTCVSDAYNDKGLMIYLRRWANDIKQKEVSKYFDDVPVKDITNGEYVGITAFQGEIFFYNLNEDNEIVRGKLVGRYCALNLNERYKSQVFAGYNNIVYEEFITDKLYLDNEPRTLMQFASTVFRDRKGRVFLVGNTLSRICPYFNEWNLLPTLRQKIGTIEIYHYHMGDTTVDLAVEYCANSNTSNSMFFGKAAKQIVSGEWDTEDLPHLEGNQEDYECVYKVLVKYQGFGFCMNLLVDKDGNRIVFIYPHTGKTRVDRIITDKFSNDKRINSRLDTSRRAEMHIANCFKFNKVCYSDNLTGTDFNHVIEQFGIL